MSLIPVTVRLIQRHLLYAFHNYSKKWLNDITREAAELFQLSSAQDLEYI